MITDQIISRGIKNISVIAVMSEIPRHLFIHRSNQALAYSDQPVPIGYGQTISQPYIVAYMTELLKVEAHHKILEIGTGSGYQAAILSKIAKEIFTIEIIPELGELALSNFKELGYNNITTRIANGYKGWVENAPFDRIILTAAPEQIPKELIAQLKPNGRMVLPLGPRWTNQKLLVLKKNSLGKIIQEKKIPVRFVPMVKEYIKNN
ncbi:MAG: protein-L-isoaspartate O-methyltransferase [Candidatus Marinimicrobia bacterium]|nr:protein-L-isoaspartate O-methyltransferase [Candidatus Neomarinimicrobiota bacterium]|tara:strand:- start:48285 stop:48905 length:621 start_codon:yes stop_codon:yes gene_type:complete